MLIDLHAHSQASDGSDTPSELVAQAHSCGLDVLAITDHDTTGGWAEAAAAAHRHSITLVRGIELTCSHGDITVHLLGYLHDPTDQTLLAEMAQARTSRERRAETITEALATDLQITYEDVLAQVAPGATVGRPHIADALVARGHVVDRAEAFTRYLHDGSPYYRPHYSPDVADGVRLILAAGGIPVIAHPFAARRGRVIGEEVIADLADAGLVGIEAHHLDHTAAQTRQALDVADRHRLVVTGSSDYHGTGKTNRLADRTTDPAQFRALLDRETAIEVVRP
ncbi:PHP domain-containing protein [Austwickia chelonae]|uniref:PHP domain-containing protein n=1 Tax=Austwickia chelonae TaxID=100225 RepID=UPI000E2681CA|nr:PHP domain-containing protein [Austwickia chelonae]